MQDNRGGFTLLELIVVLSIAAMAFALVLPKVGAGWKRMNERQFLQTLVQTLRSARLRAMNTGKVVMFRIDSRKRVYGLDDELVNRIPENVGLFAERLQEDPENGGYRTVFFPDGSQLEVEFQVVFDQLRSFYVKVHPLLGAVLLDERQGSGSVRRLEPEGVTFSQSRLIEAGRSGFDTQRMGSKSSGSFAGAFSS